MTPGILRSLANQAREVRDSTADDKLFLAAELGELLEESLFDPEFLAEVVDRIAAAAGTLGCEFITGASDLGDRLATAAVARAQNGIRVASAPQPDTRIGVVDGMLSTGWSISHKAAELRAQGVHEIVAITVLAGSDFDPTGPIDDLVVISEAD